VECTFKGQFSSDPQNCPYIAIMHTNTKQCCCCSEYITCLHQNNNNHNTCNIVVHAVTWMTESNNHRQSRVKRYLAVGELTVDNVQCGVDDANTHVGVVQGVFTHAVGKTVLHTDTSSASFDLTSIYTISYGN